MKEQIIDIDQAMVAAFYKTITERSKNRGSNFTRPKKKRKKS